MLKFIFFFVADITQEDFLVFFVFFSYDRKRHTACRVTSAHSCSVLGEGGTPVLFWLGFTSVLGRPQLGLGYSLARTWDQRPGKEPGTGVPPLERTWD